MIVLMPREFHRQRNLAGYSPWGHKEVDTTEQLALSLFMHIRPSQLNISTESTFLPVFMALTLLEAIFSLLVSLPTILGPGYVTN